MQDLVYKYGQRVIYFLIVVTLLVNWEMYSIIGSRLAVLRGAIQLRLRVLK